MRFGLYAAAALLHLTASIAHGEGSYTTSFVAADLPGATGDYVAASFILTEEPEPQDGFIIVPGRIATNKTGMIEARSEVSVDLMNDSFPEPFSVEAGGQTISIRPRPVAGGPDNLGRYMVRIEAETPLTVSLVDDPNPFVALLILAAIPYAACGVQEVWNWVNECESAGTVTFKLSVASCTVSCGDS